jgi:hypothetical protein
MVENDVSLVNKVMNLFAKRSRSKASSAASLSPARLENFGSIGFNFLHSSYCDTVSQGGGEGQYDSQPRWGDFEHFSLELIWDLVLGIR